MLLDYLKKASGMEAQLAAKEALDLASETGESWCYDFYNI